MSLADVAQEPYILLTVDEAEHSAMRYWEQAGQTPQVRLRTSSVEAVRSMVANGSGVAILSDLVHRPWSLEGKRIETLTVTDPVTPMSVGLAWHRERAFTDIRVGEVGGEHHGHVELAVQQALLDGLAFLLKHLDGHVRVPVLHALQVVGQVVMGKK